jgi:DNA-binding CsgD family transcriptional regulator/tetratricopeptide (TPR) repeat protein
MGRVSSSEMVGRSAELDALHDALRMASAGEPGCVLIAGEAGIGKSRLLAEFADRARSGGAVVLTGGCVELGDGTLPYLPFVELFRSARETLAPEHLELVDATLAELHGAGVPDVGERGASRIRSFGTVLESIGALAASSPLVLVVEDVHWIDEASRALLAFLVASMQSDRVMIAIAFRPEDLARQERLRPWMGEVLRRENVRRLDLRPLATREIGTLIERIRGEPAAGSLLTRICELSEGNPFFAEELLAVAQEDDEILPPTLTEVIRARIAALSDDTTVVLRLAAVIGRTASHAVLAAVAGMENPRLDEALRFALERQILVPAEHDQAYSFRHALFQHAIYNDLLPAERVRIHSKVAATLEERVGQGLSDASWAELAHHWYRAHVFERALGASVTAAEEAEAARAFGSTQKHFELAIDLWPRVRASDRPTGWSRARLRMRAAENAILVSEPSQAVRHARQALEEPDQESPAAIHERLGWYQLLLGNDEESLAHASKAVELTTSEPSPEAARILASLGLYLMLLNRFEESKRTCERAIEVARASGAVVEEGRALNPLGIDLAMLGNPDRGIELLRSSIAIAERAGTPYDLCRAYVNLSDVLENSGRVKEALEVTERGIEVARSAGLERSPGVVLESARLVLYVRLGRWSEIERASKRSVAPSVQGVVAAFHRSSAALVAIARGDLVSARELVAEGRSYIGETRSEVRIGLDLAEAEVALWEGRPEDSLRMTEWTSVEMLVPHQGFMIATAMRAWGDITERRSTSARGIQGVAGPEELLASARAVGDATYPDSARSGRVLSEAEFSRVQGRSDPDAWRAALESFLDPPHAYMAIYCRWRLAEAMLTASARADATRELLDAYAEAGDLGATLIVGELEALARRARVPLAGTVDAPEEAPPEPGSDLGLTTREIEVLGYLASGHTNREIASALFISPKTAGTHVSSILSKLGVTNRVEAAAIAHRLGIGDLERKI